MDFTSQTVRAALADLRSSDDRTGILAGIGTGVGVSMAVARFFLELAGPDQTPWILLPTLIALVCTTAGTALAVRAPTAGRAILWVVLANVLPPTLLCAPTVIGLVFATPSGIVAAALVLPLALLARESARSPKEGHAERDALFGAGFAALAALGMAGYAHVEPNSQAMLAPVPGLLAAGAALIMASWAFVGGLRRDWVTRAIAAGQVRGMRLGGTHEGAVVVERTVDVGSGPHRAATTREAVGSIRLAPLRMLGAAVVSTLAVVSILGVLVA